MLYEETSRPKLYYYFITLGSKEISIQEVTESCYIKAHKDVLNLDPQCKFSSQY